MHRKRIYILFSMLFILLLLTGCGGNDSASKVSASTNDKNSTNNEDSAKETSTGPVRDNTPKVLVPAADGTTVYNADNCSIDASHAQEGYIMACYTGSAASAKLQITGTSGTTYTYTLHGDYEAFPLTDSSGMYTFKALENIQGDTYAILLSQDTDITISNEFGPYLYPNQFVSFNADSEAVSLGADLAKDTHSDLDVVTNIFNYVTENITYDTDKAQTVESGYVPDIDEILKLKTGICFDYASVMASMLRSQNIPTRMEFGYVGEIYHAWISVRIDDVGWVDGIIQFDGTSWSLMDPTLVASNGENNSVKEFIGDGSNYTTKYVY